MNDVLVLPVILAEVSVFDPTLTTLGICFLSSVLTIGGMLSIDYLKKQKKKLD